MDRPLLILDLDETLVYSAERPQARACDFELGPYFVYRRPLIDEFLHTVAEWFDLAVWSSAGRDYVELLVRRIFADAFHLHFVWSCERCTHRFHPERLEPYWVKDLKKVKRMGYSLERVLVLDDSPEKLERQYGNLIRIRPFFGDESDTQLRDVLPLLERIRSVADVRAVEKRFWSGQGM